MPQSWRLAMSTFTRRQFNRTLMASVGSVWARDVVGNRASQANQQQTWAGSIADVPGIKAGHYTDSRRPTGCTALLFEGKGTAGVDYDGSAPGSHLGVLLQPVSPIDTIHGLLLTGGGPMGLSAVAGAVRYLEEHKTGFDWGIPNVRIPIVVGAVIDDLALGDARIRPDADAAYKACQTASAGQLEEGNVGVGAGATVGKMLRSKGYNGMKSGLATSSLRLGDVIIGALVVANSVGDILDRQTGKIVAGALRHDGKGFANISETLRKLAASARSSTLNISDVPLRSRSEEHTSELQSHHDLVCRLLLEKKKYRDAQSRAFARQTPRQACQRARSVCTNFRRRVYLRLCFLPFYYRLLSILRQSLS